MVVKGAGTKDNDSFVYLQEMMPTILDVAGVKPPKPVDGESILPLMMGKPRATAAPRSTASTTTTSMWRASAWCATMTIS